MHKTYGTNSINIDKLAEAYDEKRRMDPADFDRLLGLIIKYGRIQGRALEIGCGTGFHLIPLAQRLPDVQFYGIEPAYAMLIQATEKLKKYGSANCLPALADGQSLPFESGVFDFVMMSQVLHFFSDRARAAEEVYRVSSNNARLLVITTSHRQLRAQVDLSLFPGMMKRETSRIPSISAIRRLFEGHSFELYKTNEFATTFSALSAEKLVEWVASRPWSSYLLFPEEEFTKRLEGFKRNLRNAFGLGEISYLVPQTLLFFRRV
jgi:ubiquinone/menaquinone biosynthesis C-methylase UbiE